MTPACRGVATVHPVAERWVARLADINRDGGPQSVDGFTAVERDSVSAARILHLNAGVTLRANPAG
jgi:hypothetical protein